LSITFTPSPSPWTGTSDQKKQTTKTVGIVDLFLLLLGQALLLQHLLDDLLLLNEEGADNPVTDAVATSGATVRALDGLLGLGDLGVLAGAESGDLVEGRGYVSILFPCVFGAPQANSHCSILDRRRCRASWSLLLVAANRLVSACRGNRQGMQIVLLDHDSNDPPRAVNSIFVVESVSNFIASPSRPVLECDPPPLHHQTITKVTYTGELDSAVTALGGGSALLDVQDSEFTTGCLDDTSPVGRGVVAVLLR